MVRAAMAIAAPYQPASVRTVMMIPASATPEKMESTASGKGMFRRCAIIAPVQPPVPGRGIPTKSARPRAREPSSARVPILDRALSSSGLRMRSTKDKRSAARRTTTAAVLPRTHTTKAFKGPTPSHDATGTAPRSSMTGSVEMRTRMSSLGRPNDWSHRASFWPTCSFAPSSATALPAHAGDDCERAAKEAATSARRTTRRATVACVRAGLTATAFKCILAKLRDGRTGCMFASTGAATCRGARRVWVRGGGDAYASTRTASGAADTMATARVAGGPRRCCNWLRACNKPRDRPTACER
mmetsp:Transcript_11239/g.33256  ORF Transcript_11239/g.33256 Transcript_11239/m.33256 type:complete len:300 (-) Transcript_11239:20-919(-)